AHTPWPAVSPDGRHIAVARLTRHPDQQKPDTMQVILYDLKGKEARRSSEFTWALAREKASKERLNTGVFLAARAGRLIVQDYEADPGRTGIYDLARDRMIVLQRSPCAFGGTPVRPDGKGFLLVRDRGPGPTEVFLVDWEGKPRPVRMGPDTL